MSRNRLKNSQSLHWMGVVKWVLIAGLLAVLGLVYMLGKNQNLHLAEETHRLELKLDSIQKRNRDLTLDLEGMKSSHELQRRLVLMRSSLVLLTEMRSNVVAMDSSTRMRLANMGTQPNHHINLDLNPSVGTVDTSAQTPVSP